MFYWLNKLVYIYLLIVSILLINHYQTVVAIEENEYYDEYYEDEVDDAGSTTTNNIIDINGNTKQRNEFIGFYPSVGGGVVKIKKLLLDEEYLNETADNFDCVKRIEAGILTIEEIAEVKDDVEIDVIKQVTGLKKRMARIAALAAQGTTTVEDSEIDDSSSNDNTSTNNNGTSSSTSTSSNSTTVTDNILTNKKKLTFREKQDIRMKERKAQEAAREKLRPKFRLGADCETLICGACKAIVEEFGIALYNVINDSKYRYVEDVFIADFCNSKDVKVKYTDLVADICSKFEMESLGYRDALLLPFESHDNNNWKDIASPHSLIQKKMKVCIDIGACDMEQFEFVSTPQYYTQEHWDEKCFVCQAFARDFEERIQLIKYITESNIVPIAKATCDRLNLPSKYHTICETLTTGRLLDDIAWLGKVHIESVLRKSKAELSFHDKLCEEINYCKPYIDPVKLKEKEAQQTMENVFF